MVTIVHGLPYARAAIAQNPAVTLVSAPGAALYAGVLWWRELIAILRDEGYVGVAYLDCADQPAQAIEAIHCGITHLVLEPHPLCEEISHLCVRAGGHLLLAHPGPRNEDE